MNQEPNRPTWWYSVANCRKRGLATAYANPVGGNRLITKKVCEGCWALDTCAWYAMALEEPGLRYGVFGGMSAVDRQRFMARYNLTPAYARHAYQVARADLWLALESRTMVDWPSLDE